MSDSRASRNVTRVPPPGLCSETITAPICFARLRTTVSPRLTVAPAGTPRDIVARLNAETVRALKLPDVRQLMLAQGAEPVSDTPEQFAALVKSDIAKWSEVVRKSGAKAD